MHIPSRLALRTLLLLVAFAGCGDESDPGMDGSDSAASSPSGGDPGPVAENCPARCTAMTELCGAPENVASAQCDSACGGMLTEDQLACLEDQDCATLTDFFSGTASACDIGGGSASGGSASGGSATGSTPEGEIGDVCECSNLDVDFESCSGTDSSCGDLTCYVESGEGICSQPCNADAGDCPAGVCTIHVIDSVEVGTWCVP